MRNPIYIVFDGHDRDESSIMLVTRNPRSAARIYFSERQKVNGLRPYVYTYHLGDSTSEKLIGHDELMSHLEEHPMFPFLFSQGETK